MKYVLTAALFFSLPTFANEKNLYSPERLYTILSKSFPKFKESTGGFSSEINMDSLICSSSLAEKNKVKTECIGTAGMVQVFIKDGRKLFLTLLNTNVELDRTSEPGTTYIELNNLTCGVLEPKADINNPAPSKPEYYCTVSE